MAKQDGQGGMSSSPGAMQGNPGMMPRSNPAGSHFGMPGMGAGLGGSMMGGNTGITGGMNLGGGIQPTGELLAKLFGQASGMNSGGQGNMALGHNMARHFGQAPMQGQPANRISVEGFSGPGKYGTTAY